MECEQLAAAVEPAWMLKCPTSSIGPVAFDSGSELRALHTLRGFRSGEGDLVAFFEGDDRFFPVGSLASLSRALAAVFAADVECVDLSDFYFEEVLNGLTNLSFVGAGVGDDGVL